MSTLMGTVHHKHVHAWEVRAAAAHVLWVRAQHADMSDQLASGGLSFAVHAIRGDATNSEILQGAKLHNLQVESLYAADTAVGARVLATSARSQPGRMSYP